MVLNFGYWISLVRTKVEGGVFKIFRLPWDRSVLVLGKYSAYEGPHFQ